MVSRFLPLPLFFFSPSGNSWKIAYCSNAISPPHLGPLRFSDAPKMHQRGTLEGKPAPSLSLLSLPLSCFFSSRPNTEPYALCRRANLLDAVVMMLMMLLMRCYLPFSEVIQIIPSQIHPHSAYTCARTPPQRHCSSHSPSGRIFS